MNLKLINTTIKNKLFFNTPSIIFKFGNFFNTKLKKYWRIRQIIDNRASNNCRDCVETIVKFTYRMSHET